MVPMQDKSIYELNVCINKALNSVEAPLKLKHVRSIIISTHRLKEAKTLWTLITRQPLLENRFTAWKFCHLLHKLIRDGHQSVIEDSQMHKKMILEVGKLWGHLNDGVGVCVQSYTKLLVTKLDFHHRNSSFSGNLLFVFEDLEKKISADIGDYFQMAVEIFDYLEAIINLQKNVFDSVNMYCMSSMTPQGQCRLAPLIPLMQDSTALYDLSVRIMFKLHLHLSNDTLMGHRDRFRVIFNQLKTFYDNVRPLQYFADVIRVPYLPGNAPNFFSEVDLGTYVPPIVQIPSDSYSIEEKSNTSDGPIVLDTLENQCNCENLLQTKDVIIQAQKSQIDSYKCSIESIKISHQREVDSLCNQISELNVQMKIYQETSLNFQDMRDDLRRTLESTENLQDKDEDEKFRTMEDKFKKMKTMYSQIRDEHISLLRQHGEITKMLNLEKKRNSEQLAEKGKLLLQITELEGNRNGCRNCTEKSIEIVDLQNKILKYEEVTSSQKNNNEEPINEMGDNLSTSNKNLNADEIKVDCSTLDKSSKNTSESELEEVLHRYLILDEKFIVCAKKVADYESLLELTKAENKTASYHLLKAIIEDFITFEQKRRINYNLCSAGNISDNLILTAQDLSRYLEEIQVLYKPHLENEESINLLTRKVSIFNLLVIHFQLQCMLLCLECTDSQRCDEIQTLLNGFSKCISYIFDSIQKFESTETVSCKLNTAFDELNRLTSKISSLATSSDKNESLQELVESEMLSMDKAINEASIKISQLLLQAKGRDNGVKLEVNENILDACTHLMETIRVLIKKSKILQTEIVSKDKGQATKKEFYKRNSQWSEGLISASKNIANGASLLVRAADNIVSGSSSDSMDLIVAAHDIAGCTAQLVVASRVKAQPGSQNLSNLIEASRNVSLAIAGIIATVKDSDHQDEDNFELDLNNLSSHQAKTKEMELRVNILHLEHSLQVERLRLSALRKQNYQNFEE